MKVSILKSTRLRHKFCSRMNKDFGCKDAYMCEISCPLWLCFHTECLMEDKNLPLGEAYRLTVRESIPEGKGRKIIADIVESRSKPYPPENWKKKFYKEDLEAEFIQKKNQSFKGRKDE